MMIDNVLLHIIITQHWFIVTSGVESLDYNHKFLCAWLTHPNTNVNAASIMRMNQNIPSVWMQKPNIKIIQVVYRVSMFLRC